MLLPRCFAHLGRPPTTQEGPWLLRRPLVSDNLILNLVIDVLGDNLLVSQVVLAVIWPMLDDRLGAGRAHPGKLVELLGARRVYIDQSVGLVGFAGRLLRRG